MKRAAGAIAAVMVAFLVGAARGAEPAGELPDLRSVPADLVVPAMTEQEPGPGRRVRCVTPGFEKTQVYHALYLPGDWQRGRKFPVIVEFAGNGHFHDDMGDVSTGRVEDSKLGFGVSGGRGFIWVCMPYLSGDGQRNVITWWGDKPAYDPGPTLRYCKATVRDVCGRFGGDEKAVILAGFSRGAIACNFLGLHDDEVAGLWRAFIVYSHYDGVRPWPYPGSDRDAALRRLKRLGNRPQFICDGSAPNLAATRRYLESTGVHASLTFQLTGFRNHDDAWVLRPSPARLALRRWLDAALQP